MTTCPTPSKQRYYTVQAAWAQVEVMRKRAHASVDLKPYRCACGVWHIGHSQASLGFRIRQARRKGRA